MSLWPAIYTHINKPVFSTLLQTLRATLHSPLKIKCISTVIQVKALHCLKIRLYNACLILKSIGFLPKPSLVPPLPCPYAVPTFPSRTIKHCPFPLNYPSQHFPPPSLTVKTPLLSLDSPCSSSWPFLAVKAPHPTWSPFGSLPCSHPPTSLTKTMLLPLF